MWKWIIYTLIIIAVISALAVAIIYSPKCNKGCSNSCCGSSQDIKEQYLDIEEVEDNPGDNPRKYIGHRYDRDHDRKPTQYGQLGHY